MAKYIDKDAIVAEIERRIKVLQNHPKENHKTICHLDAVKQFLDTLEVKEEVLDKNDKTKLMQKCVHKAYKRGYDMGVLLTTNKIKHNTKKVDLEKEFDNYAKDILACDVQFEPFTHLHKCAKYFFELGMAARNKSQKRE